MPDHAHSLTHRVLLFLAPWALLPLTALAMRQADAKLPLPEKASQQKARQVVKELFGSEYDQAKTSKQKLAFAEKLLEQASQTKGDPAGHFVLLQIARDVATQAGEIETAFWAIDELGMAFQIDPAQMQSETLPKAAKAAKLAKQHKSVAEHVLSLVDTAIAKDDYATATRLTKEALAAGRKSRDKELVKQINGLGKEVRQLRRAYAEIEEALATLDKKPGDTEANLAVGRFYCLVKVDWEKGISRLALGNDPALRELALKELKGVASPEEGAKLGDAWWDLAQATNGTERDAIMLHAGSWYEQAQATMSSGLAKVRVTKRLKEISRIGPSLVNTSDKSARQRAGHGASQKGNVALANNGTTVTGVKWRPVPLLDGISTDYDSYAESKTPCEWIITFDKVYRLREVRFRFWDKHTDDHRYRYVMATSMDGEKYIPLVNRSQGFWISWQTIKFSPRPVKTIKLTGLPSGYVNNRFHVMEFEAYCFPPEEPPR